MTIRRGEPWGEPMAAPLTAPVAHDDAAAAQVISAALSAGDGLPEVVIAGGDLARTMGGGTEDRVQPGATLVRAPVDLIRVTTPDGRSGFALAHVVVRTGRSAASWWRGGVVLAMNAQYLGPYDVAPRSHPNDGRIDVVRVEASMRVRQRLSARRRAITGSHLPHPGLRVEAVHSVDVSLGGDMHVWLDGQWWGRTPSVTLAAVADAAVVYA